MGKTKDLLKKGHKPWINIHTSQAQGNTGGKNSRTAVRDNEGTIFAGCALTGAALKKLLAKRKVR